MIVPDHWAEARRQFKAKGRSITVRRYGWSATTPAEAEAMAAARAEEALQQLVGGAQVARHEPKVAYNGADGVPIREEVLARHGEQVITRNAYGAHCLNSPNALFADIDFVATPAVAESGYFLPGVGLAVAAAIGVGVYYASWKGFFMVLLVSLVVSQIVLRIARWLFILARGGPGRVAQQRIHRFLRRNPEWNVRLYRTPGGLRVLATHRPFEAADPEVLRFFKAIGTDPVYVQMCRNQRCFRARLTAKPWRIGIESHMRPRPGVWPIRPERMAVRKAWIDAYEARAAGFAACSFTESIGSGVIHDSVAPAIHLHDRVSRALETGVSLA